MTGGILQHFKTVGKRMDKGVRRLAFHEVITDNGTIAPGVVEMMEGHPVRVYPLDGEQEATEWWGGCVTIKQADGRQPEAYYKGEKIK